MALEPGTLRPQQGCAWGNGSQLAGVETLSSELPVATRVPRKVRITPALPGSVCLRFPRRFDSRTAVLKSIHLGRQPGSLQSAGRGLPWVLGCVSSGGLLVRAVRLHSQRHPVLETGVLGPPPASAPAVALVCPPHSHRVARGCLRW